MAFIAVRSYFLLLCFSRQVQIHNFTTQVNIVLPFMTLLQIFFYLAWAKVAEEQLNPLGTDDDDFESDYIIDRNLTVSMLMAGRFSQFYPEQHPDAFDKQQGTPTAPPSATPPPHSYRGSVAHVKLGTKAKMVKKINRQSHTFATADIDGKRAKRVKMIPREASTFAAADIVGRA
ncbi:Protein BEST-1 [Aphelenchoides avenae]|nr:Protein BEST-1 [Aphelenchus avenae]